MHLVCKVDWSCSAGCESVCGSSLVLRLRREKVTFGGGKAAALAGAVGLVFELRDWCAALSAITIRASAGTTGHFTPRKLQLSHPKRYQQEIEVENMYVRRSAQEGTLRKVPSVSMSPWSTQKCLPFCPSILPLVRAPFALSMNV